MKKILFLSIKPKYAEEYFTGQKKIELRKIKPNLENGDFVFFYVTSPLKQLSLIGEVDQILCASPQNLWKTYQKQTGMTYKDFFDYFESAENSYFIKFKKLVTLETPIKLEVLKKIIPKFIAPQSFIYYDEALFELEMFRDYKKRLSDS